MSSLPVYDLDSYFFSSFFVNGTSYDGERSSDKDKVKANLTFQALLQACSNLGSFRPCGRLTFP